MVTAIWYKIAGITEPPVLTLGSDDPLAYVHSMDMRRNITKSQRAMLEAVRLIPKGWKL